MITIITVCYNCKSQLNKTILSLKNQTDKNFEYIVIDGYSNDGTLDVIKSNLDIINLFISEKDNGIYDAMNKGIQLANGEYISFLNADDTYDVDFIKSCNEIIYQKSIDYIYSSVYAIKAKSKKKYIPKLIDINFSFDRMTFPHPGLVVKKNIFNEIGKFDQNYKYASDLDWILKLVSNSNFLGCRNENSFVNYTIGGAGNSIKSLNETIKIYSKYNKSYFFKFKTFTIGILKLIYIKTSNEK